MPRRIAPLPWILGLLAGCGTGRAAPLDVGSDDAGGGTFTGGGDDGGAFEAHFEQKHVVVTVVTVSCSGGCADVQAVATGGYPPYAFAWDDGTTNPARTVCPTSSRAYRVKATDMGTGGELARPPETVEADLTASVMRACPDGGARGGCDSVAAQFSVTGANPSGPWSYGWSLPLGGAMTRYPLFVAAHPADADAGPYDPVGFDGGAGINGFAQWYDPSLGNGYSGAVPDVGLNPFPTEQHPSSGVNGVATTFLPGQFGMWPGLLNQYTVARWTASKAGTYTVTARFSGMCGYNGYPKTTTDVHVQHNGADVDSGGIHVNGGGNDFASTKTITVVPGDTIDFAVGNGGNSYLYDMTGLDAQVCRSGG